MCYLPQAVAEVTNGHASSTGEERSAVLLPYRGHKTNVSPVRSHDDEVTCHSC